MLDVPHAFGLDIFENMIYWTDWTRMGIMAMEKFGGRSHLLWNNTSGNVYPMGIVTYHRSLQPSGTGTPHEYKVRYLLKI